MEEPIVETSKSEESVRQETELAPAAPWSPLRKVLSTLGKVVVFGSLAFTAFFVLAFIITLAGGGKARGSDYLPRLSQALVDGDPKSEKKIAIIPIEGVIVETMGTGRGSVTEVQAAIKTIQDDENFVGVLLVIDSPGGGVTASDRIYHDLLEFKKTSKLPIHALFLDVAASGGYYVAMASDHITAHPTSVTGSIGVISQFFNFSDAMEKVGVSVNVIKSLNSEGEVSFKDIGSPYRPMRPEERQLMQGLITEMWERFAGIVADGRKGHLTLEEAKKLADGRVFTGNQALKLKLIDSVGYSQDAYQKIREACQEKDAKIVTFQRKESLLQELRFGLQSGWHQGRVSHLSVARDLLSEKTGFLYLWTAGGL